MANTLQRLIVKRASQLVANKSTWTSCAPARSASGTRCLPYEPRAVRFCAYGALWRAAFELTGDSEAAQRITRSIERSIMRGDSRKDRLSQINDGRGRRAVLTLLQVHAAD